MCITAFTPSTTPCTEGLVRIKMRSFVLYWSFSLPSWKLHPVSAVICLTTTPPLPIMAPSELRGINTRTRNCPSALLLGGYGSNLGSVGYFFSAASAIFVVNASMASCNASGVPFTEVKGEKTDLSVRSSHNLANGLKRDTYRAKYDRWFQGSIRCCAII